MEGPFIGCELSMTKEPHATSHTAQPNSTTKNSCANSRWHTCDERSRQMLSTSELIQVVLEHPTRADS